MFDAFAAGEALRSSFDSEPQWLSNGAADCVMLRLCWSTDSSESQREAFHTSARSLSVCNNLDICERKCV